MKKFYLHIILWGLLVLSVTACDKESLPFEEEKQMETVRTNDEEMPVCLAFEMPQEDDDAATRASVVGGNEKADGLNFISHMEMLCFTEEGIYLGHRPAVLVDDERWFDDGHQGRKLFTGTVPARTARIHFIGNADDSKYPGNDQVGGSENLLVKSARMTISVDDRSITYWGFHGEGTAQEMSSWLAVRTQVFEQDGVTPVYDENGNYVYEYTQNEGSIVHMLRDRAKLEFGTMGDLKSANGNDYYIKSIKWILVNGLKQGYIAPYNKRNSADPFNNYYNDATQSLNMDDNWKNPYNAGGRYSQVGEDAAGQVHENQMMTIYQNGNGVTGETVNNPIFLFEDDNNQENPPKIILKVVYQDLVRGKGEVTKYHTLMMLDSDNTPCRILRNHSYKLNISRLPWEGLGHLTFADAVNSVEYANNRTVSISDKVAEVNDGKFKLSLEGGTYLIYQHDSDATTHTINFTYEAIGNDETVPVDKTFTANWVNEPDEESFARRALSVSFTRNTATKGTGSLTFELVSISDYLQSGQIELRDPATGMARTINIYTIKKFSLGEPTLVRLNTTRQVNGVACDQYKLTFTIPNSYPAGLYPINVRMATTTLNPHTYRWTENNTQNEATTIGVLLETTVPNQVFDGEVLTYDTNPPYTTTTNRWNTEEAGKPWNYWFSFTLSNKPATTDIGVTTYEVIFDDVRPLRAAANRANNVGLFLKIKYFGNAVAVTPE